MQVLEQRWPGPIGNPRLDNAISIKMSICDSPFIYDEDEEEDSFQQRNIKSKQNLNKGFKTVDITDSFFDQIEEKNIESRTIFWDQDTGDHTKKISTVYLAFNRNAFYSNIQRGDKQSFNFED